MHDISKFSRMTKSVNAIGSLFTCCCCAIESIVKVELTGRQRETKSTQYRSPRCHNIDTISVVGKRFQLEPTFRAIFRESVCSSVDSGVGRARTRKACVHCFIATCCHYHHSGCHQVLRCVVGGLVSATTKREIHHRPLERWTRTQSISLIGADHLCLSMQTLF